MDADGFTAVRRRRGRGPRRPEAVPYEGGGGPQDAAAAAEGALRDAGTAAMENEAAQLLRRVDPVETEAKESDSEAEAIDADGGPPGPPTGAPAGAPPGSPPGGPPGAAGASSRGGPRRKHRGPSAAAEEEKKEEAFIRRLC
ncbi:hypothetical protein ETH_00020210, partial [Eimeria tenella]